MNVPEASVELESGSAGFDLESVFLDHYRRIARLIGSIIRDPGRAEELAVEVFLKLPAGNIADPAKVTGWLRLTAVRLSLDEVRRRSRQERLDRHVHRVRHPLTPEEIQIASDRGSRVAHVIAAMDRRDAEILVLRAEGMTYEEIGAALSLKPTSVGTLIIRAQKAFRKEYVKKYGTPESLARL